MIKYNSNTINEWNYGSDNIVKVYRNNAVCYYKISGGGDTPTAQTPCYAVVDDISQYSDTEFEDVFNKADEKWYKLNNLNQYEEYGVYGSGRTITTYEGKLTIDEEITPSPSRLPQGYTEVEYIRQNSNYNAYIDTGVIPFDNTTNTYTITTRLTSEFHSNLGCATIISCENPVGTYYGLGYRYKCSSTVDQLEFYGSYPNYSSSVVDNGDGTRTVSFQSTGNTSWTITTPLSYFCSFSSTSYDSNSAYRFADATIYSATIVKNGSTVRDFVPAKRDSDSMYGLYDLITDTFYTSPNGNNFSGGSEVTPPPITATCEFIYSGGSWVNVGEVSGGTASLPNVPFSVNYNANNYDANTKTLAKTSGQLVDVDAVITAGTPTVNDGYLTIASGTRATISGYQTYFNRDNNNPNLTIISKQRTDGSNCHMFANRDSNYNWMYRPYATYLTLHGTSQQGSIAVTTQPVIESVRVDSSRLATYNNYTDNTSSTQSSFNYGSTNSGNFAMFQGYASSTGEYFVGDFYWVYMSQNTLTDEQVQQVIAYNEGGGGVPEYPMYYDEIQDPPNNVSFSSMTEAEAYECPWVGMYATIDGDKYVFSGDSISGYEWVESVDFQKQYLTFVATESGTFKFSGNSINYSLDDGVTWTTLASNTNSPTVSAGNKILWKATLTPSSNGIGRFYSSGLFVVEGNVMSLLFGDNFSEQTSLVGKDYAFNSLFSGCTNVTSAENLSLPATTLSTSCYQYLFLDCSNISVVPSVLLATTLADNCYNGMFGNCTSLTTAPKILATTLVSRCCQYMYVNCSSLNNVTCLATNPSTSYTTSWLSGVAASGTFYKSPNATWSTSVDGIPSNWTVVDYTS